MVGDLPTISDPEFAGWARSYLAKPLTQAYLDAIGRHVQEGYRRRGSRHSSGDYRDHQLLTGLSHSR
jgi:hypothetical protein